MTRTARVYWVSALVIRERDLGEADRIVVLLTRERGKLSAVGKAARRPRSKLAAGLQLFSHLRAHLAVGRSLDIITQLQLLAAHYHLRDDLGRYAHACYVCELVDVLTEERAPDAAAFDLLLATFAALDRGGDAATLVRGFELKLLTHLGYGPELDACVLCGAGVGEGAVGFSTAEGGTLCHRCRQAQGAASLEAGTLRAMKDLIGLSPEALAERRLRASVRQELERIMRSYVDYRLERPLRSAAFLAR